MVSPALAFQSPAAEAEARREARPEVRLESVPITRRRRGPLRPSKLVLVRRRVGPQTIARGFSTLDALVLTFLAVLAARGAAGGALVSAEIGRVAPFVVGAVAAAWALRAVGAYAYNASERLSGHLLRVFGAFALAGTAAFLTLFVLSAWRDALPVAVWTVSAAVLVATLHVAAYDLTRNWRRNGRMTPNLVFVGATGGAERLIERAMASREVAVLGVFDDRRSRAPDTVHGVPVLGGIDDLLEHRITPFVDRIVITVTDATNARTRELIERLRGLPNEVTLLVDADVGGADSLGRVIDAPLAFVNGRQSDESRAFDKRVQDLVLASVGLVLALPVLLLTALAVKLDSPGPVFFRQRRHGFNNEVITVWKFRSMRQESADGQARRQVTAGDERVTRVGRFIRRTSLDELPQILNVLRGEMSIVGPRPHAVGMITGDTEASRLVCEYAHRHRMKPGITGWAQISGSRGPLHTPEAVCERVALDCWYIERQSLWLDLWIVALTVPRLLGDKAAIR
jgi:Undecaprenyl-phosphate glucose phosphotransferase